MNPVELANYMACLAASQTEQRMNDVAARFQSGGSNISATQVCVFLAVVAVVGLVLWRVARVAAMRDGRSYYSPKRLFAELCQLHELDWASRRLLRRLAHALRLEHPAQLFLEPAFFEAARMPTELRSEQTRLKEFKRRLFES